MTTAPEHFDAVVVGSGFGGSVVTYRLAEARLRVCLLERGKAYPPNSFPRAPHDMAKNFWDPSEGLFGMFSVWSFRHSGGVVASGLGGGSLIYANILARKDPKWFKFDLADGSYKDWPLVYDDLAPHYTQVEQMMNAQKYPLSHEPYSCTPKTLAMQEAAGLLGDEDPKGKWIPLNLAVSFRRDNLADPDASPPDNPPIIGAEINERFKNYHASVAGRQVPRSTCRLCGECDIGCNFGSKNTLDHTYITAAINQAVPADVRTLCEVKTITPREGKTGYAIEYVVHDPNADPSGSPHCVTLTCDRLVLSAGTFGTPYLLLKNADRLPNLSGELGKRYSVNGDLLSFVSKAMEKRGRRSSPRRLDPSFGPVITSAIRFGDVLDGEGETGRGFYVEDGGQPALMSWLAQVSGLPGFLARSAKFLKLAASYQLGFSNDADLGAEIADLIGNAEGSMSTMPILSMGRDLATGQLLLRDGLLDCTWSIRDSKEYFDRVRRACKAIARVLNAEYLDNPSYKFNFQQVLTAHPLGGCAMAATIDEGVVDTNCEVFGHPSLYVVDGSVMPSAVGPNPSLTIAAIADRVAGRMAEKRV